MIFALMPVLSKTWWESRDFEATLLDAPPSTGPYKIKDIQPGRKITFERVPNHWAADTLGFKGHFNFDEITFDYYRDSDIAREAFKSGDLNLRREWDAAAWHTKYDDIKDGISLETLDHKRPDRVRAFIMNTRRAPFDDHRVRAALTLLLDFEFLNKTLFYGAYKQIDSYYPNTDLAYDGFQNPSGDMRTRLREAARILKSSGWIVQDGKRVHEETGQVFTFEILLDNAQNEKIALSFIRNLEKLGIQANVRTLDTAAFRGRINEYEYDVLLYYWLSSLSPGTEQYLYWSCEAANQKARFNYAGVCDPNIDTLSKAIADAKTRKELIRTTKALDEALLNEHYMIPLYYNPVDYVAYHPPIKRPAKTPLYGMVIETWWSDLQ